MPPFRASTPTTAERTSHGLPALATQCWPDACSSSASTGRYAFHAVLLLPLTAVTVTLSVAVYGFATDRRNVAIVGAAATAAIAVAMALRAAESIRAVRRSSLLLDDALAESERARHELN